MYSPGLLQQVALPRTVNGRATVRGRGEELCFRKVFTWSDDHPLYIHIYLYNWLKLRRATWMSTSCIFDGVMPIRLSDPYHNLLRRGARKPIISLRTDQWGR